MALKALYDTDRLFIRVHVYMREWVRWGLGQANEPDVRFGKRKSLIFFDTYMLAYGLVSDMRCQLEVVSERLRGPNSLHSDCVRFNGNESLLFAM
jgi:hypothetical protein